MKKEYHEVFLAHGEKCVYCGKKATTVDHLTPKTHGGTDDFENLAPCCGTCNPRKGARTAEGYIRYLLLKGVYKKIDDIMAEARARILQEIEHGLLQNAGPALAAINGVAKVLREKQELAGRAK